MYKVCSKGRYHASLHVDVDDKLKLITVRVETNLPDEFSNEVFSAHQYDKALDYYQRLANKVEHSA